MLLSVPLAAAAMLVILRNPKIQRLVYNTIRRLRRAAFSDYHRGKCPLSKTSWAEIILAKLLPRNEQRALPNLEDGACVGLHLETIQYQQPSASKTIKDEAIGICHFANAIHLPQTPTLPLEEEEWPDWPGWEDEWWSGQEWDRDYKQYLQRMKESTPKISGQYLPVRSSRRNYFLLNPRAKHSHLLTKELYEEYLELESMG
jgi:hypothetical protein